MATGQLIPDWRHPSETTFIFDNTVVQDTESMNTEAVTLISVFGSSKGIDNKLIKKQSLYSFVEEYGYPNFKLYGQAPYIPYTALSTGNASVWAMRVMPEDATYGNVFYTVEYRTNTRQVQLDETKDEYGNYINPEKTINVLEVVFTPEYSEEINTDAMFDAILNSEEVSTTTEVDGVTTTITSGTVRTTPNSDGFYKLPLIGFRMLGRGEYAKYFRVRLANDISSDKENVYKNYTLGVINTEMGIVEKETFPALTFDEDAIDPKTRITSYINEVVNDYEGDGSKRIAVKFMGDNHKKIFEYYKANVDPDTKLTNDTFDIFGYDRLTGTDNKRIVILVKDPETGEYKPGEKSNIALLGITGVKLAGGSDGSVGIDVPSADREATYTALFTRAFDQVDPFDPKILSTLRAPANVMLDASFNMYIKGAMAALAYKRNDLLLYLDTLTLQTVGAIKDYVKNSDNSILDEADSYLISKNCGMFQTRDPITGKKMPVSITMWLAYKIPMHWRQKGLYTPMAGEEYATLSGYIKNSIKPEIDANDHEIKEELYDARFNYIECIAENTFIRGTQQTSQKALSDLSEENNVHVMLQVKRRIERLCAQKRYHFGEAVDRKMFTADAKELFSTWKGVYLRDIDIKFTMNRYEELRSILHCTCSIVFMTLIKRSVIEININPRA